MSCEKCGKKFTEELNYLPKKRTYTDRFRKKIVAEVLNSDLKNTAERNGVSEQEIETMLKDLGEDLITAKPQGLKKLGIEEIAMINGKGHYYAVLVNIDTGKIVGLGEKRREEALTEYLKLWEEEVLSQIEEVSIGLWIGYKNVAEKLMPQAQIVGDRFQVMKQDLLRGGTGWNNLLPDPNPATLGGIGLGLLWLVANGLTVRLD